MSRKSLFLLSCLLLTALWMVVAGQCSLPSLEGVEAGFKFVVLGDNRTGGTDIYEVTDTYKRIIAEINELRPVFSVLVGDIIRGGVNQEGPIREMWRRWIEATSPLQVPLFKVVGNHDVWSELSERLYQEIFDEPLYYSFDYRGCHFVVLNSEVVGAAGKITGEQFRWLEEDLSQNQDARYTFVFLHRPLWGSLRGDPAGWAPVHRLLVEKGVDAVFAGHDHMYLADEVDRIHYIVTAGAGAPLYSAQEETGGFFHYCLVSVEEQGFTIAVIKPGNIESEDVVLASDLDLVNEIINEWIGDAIVDLEAAGEKKPVTLRIENRSPGTAYGELEWDLGGSEWVIEPLSASGSVPAGGSTTLRFLATPPKTALYPAPKVLVTCPLGPGRSLTAEKPLLFVPRVELGPTMVSGPTLDGRIEPEEWEDAVVLTNFPLNSGLSLATQSTTAYVAWDEDNLYAAFVCEEHRMDAMKAEVTQRDDQNIWKDDCVEIFLDTNHDRTSYYHLVVNSKGIVTDDFHAQPSLTGDASWNAQALVGTSLGVDSWTVEMAIPFADLGGRPQVGQSWGVNLGRERQPEPREFSIFSCTYGGFNTPKRFADLLFGS